MAEDVRIAMTDRTLLKWPQRCPRCGESDFLVSRDIVVMRDQRRRRPSESALHHALWAGDLGEKLRIPVPTCRHHARTNQVGGWLLRPDALPRFLRLTAYAFVAWMPLLALAALHAGLDPWLLLRSQSRYAWAAALFGVLGTIALAWAHRVACVRPVRLDPHFQTATVRFRDARYADEFRLMNAEATTRPQVTRGPGWRRLSIKDVIVVGLVALLVTPLALLLFEFLF